MLCPFCNYENSKVLESRTTAEKSSIRRRRECESCGRRFTTYERVEVMPIFVIKRSGTREDYSRVKLFNSIKQASHKCNLTIEQIEEIVDSIESELANIGKREVNTNFLGKLTMDRLKELEKIAYIRYSSVYNHFKSVDDFVLEATNLIENP